MVHPDLESSLQSQLVHFELYPSIPTLIIKHELIAVKASITLIHSYILYKFLISFNEQIPHFVLFIFISISILFLLTFCDNEIDSQGNGETSELSVIVETAMSIFDILWVKVMRIHVSL